MKRSFSKRQKSAIAAKHDWFCAYCGKDLSTEDYEIDHVTPFSKGGLTSLKNGVLSCVSCNRKKSNTVGTYQPMLVGDERMFQAGRLEVKEKLSKVQSLRKWQQLAQFEYNKVVKKQSIFVVEVCPGGGKTFFAVHTAAAQFVQNAIDYVIAIAPSLIVCDGWLSTASSLGFRALTSNSLTQNFAADVNFRIATYQSSLKTIENLPPRSRVLVICDEYHHAEDGKDWGDRLQVIKESIGSRVQFLFLSGTPWRTRGYIAMLRENGYYQPDEQLGGEVVKPDFSYTYKEDLESETRATTAASFYFYTSVRTDKKSGQVERLISPSDQFTSADIAKQEEECPCPYSLGKHVSIEDARLSNNTAAQEMIFDACDKLHAVQAKYSEKILMLVVAKSITEARRICEYIIENHDLNAVVIASDDPESAKKLKQIKTQLASGSKLKTHRTTPDVIVSVGMVSEGVDIPHIKVIVYLSAILTLLYLIQVLFRGARRVPRSGKQGYCDDSKTFDWGVHFYHIAHPKIVWASHYIEKQIPDVYVPNQSDDSEDSLEDLERLTRKASSSDWQEVVDGEIDRSVVFRGQYIEAQFKNIVDFLVEADQPAFCDSNWRDSIINKYMELPDLAKKEIDDILANYDPDLELDTVKTVQQPTYEDVLQKLKRKAQRLRGKIRHSLPSLKKVDDNVAFREVSRHINKKAGFKFSEATLEQKYQWVETAEQIYESILNKNGEQL